MRNILIIIFFVSIAFVYTDRSTAQVCQTNGDAVTLSNSCYIVSLAQSWSIGSVWYYQQLDLDNPFNIEITMNFGTKDTIGADGIVFVLQQVGLSAIGTGGYGIGFVGFLPALGIEFDTYNNGSNGDLAADHIAILRDGNTFHTNPTLHLAGPVQASVTGINIEDGADHIVKISWDPTCDSIKVYFDCNFRLSLKYDVISDIFSGNPDVWWGFTSATGAYNNIHKVCVDTANVMKDTAICKGDTIQLNAYEGGTDYLWSPYYAISDTAIGNPFVYPGITTKYYVSYKDKCGLQKYDSVTVTTEPYIDFTADTSYGCAPLTVTFLDNSTPSGNLTYFWDFGNGDTLSYQSPTYTYYNDGVYNVKHTVTTELGCTDTDSLIITVGSIAADAGADQSLCNSGNIVLQANNGMSGYLWSNSETTQTITVNPSSSITYTVTVTDNNGCTGSDEVIITINTTPTADAGNDDTICENESYVITAAGGTTYLWNTGETLASFTITPSVTNTYTVTAYNSGCTDTDEIIITVYQLPVISAGNDNTICQGESAVLTAAGGVSYQWNTNETGSSITVSPVVSVIYTVTGFDASNCSGTDQVTIVVNEFPYVNLRSDTCIYDGTIIAIDAVNCFDGCLWQDGAIGQIYNVAGKGLYYVTVNNYCGSASDSVLISECPTSAIWMPNSFSPNGDGSNDVFRPAGINVTEFELYIYDRWGKKIFYTKDIDTGWNGKYEGELCPGGVYSWFVYYRDIDNTQKKKKYGHVILLR